MVTPGRYKHYEGGSYRVLFSAMWEEDTRQPRNGQPISVWAETPMLIAGTRPENALLPVLWVGGRLPKSAGLVVVYCDLDGVYARTEEEFEEVLPGDLHVARFTLVPEEERT